MSAPGSSPMNGAFATTRWSVVLSAARGASGSSSAALAQLCESYWYPLYAFVRRSGHPPHDAQDLTQEFFARLLEKGWLRDVSAERGRFRSFLLTAVKHFLANEWDRAHRLKRGGGQVPLSLDAVLAEDRYACEPADLVTPEQVYDRRWACTILEKVLTQLHEEFAAIGRETVFQALEPGLTGGKLDYPALAERLQLTEGALRIATHRLRLRYRDLIRAHIADTVAADAEVEDELRQLFAALAR